MADLTEPKKKLQIRALANEYLLRSALIRLMLLDPGFAQAARQRLDTLLGHYLTQHDDSLSREALSAIREDYLHLLTMAEQLAAAIPITPARPKTIRRRIFEWFEHG